jgi:hypothetical protein
MKVLVTTLLCAGCLFAQKPAAVPVKATNVQNAMMFDKQLFVLKFVDQNKVVQLNEYYLREETPENWTRMISATVFLINKTPGEMATQMERDLLQTHPDAPHDLRVTPDGQHALFMCLNWSGDREKTGEFDVFRFEKHPRGILGYQLSLRPYQAKISAEDYKALRLRWAQTIQTMSFPEVLLKMP